MSEKMSTTQRILDILNDNAGISDPRMNLFLMRSPLQFITIIALYLSIIFKFGPSFMKNRKPYSLRNVLIIYNIIQILANLYIFSIMFLYSEKLIWFCSNPDTSNSPANLLELKGHYLYVLLKFFDLIETVFYVLRKKDRQISFLHVYHHIGILLAAWISGKYFPGGQAIFVGFYNSFIHAIMYCYYLITCWSPNSSRLLWWKKYVTVLQIIQHCLIIISVFPAVVNFNCLYPKGWMAAFSLNVLVIIYLFVQFYRNTYLKKKTK